MKNAHRKTHKLTWIVLLPLLLMILLFFGRPTDNLSPQEAIPGLDNNPDQLKHRLLP